MIPQDWKVTTLDAVSDPAASIRYGVVQIGPNTTDGVPIVAIKYIGRIATAPLHRAAHDIEGPYKNSRVQGGDVLLSVKGTIGEVGLVPPGFSGNIAREIARIRPSQDVRADYLAHQLQAPETQVRMKALTVGTTRLEFSIAAVKKFEILLPPLPEQRRIAEILSTWNRAIETVEALISNARTQKKALMQALLTGKKRLPGFNGEWSTAAIGDVAREVSERGLAHADYPVLSCSKYDGMVRSLSYFNKKVYSDNTSNYKVMRRGTFGFPSNHVEEGSIGYQDICDVGIVSPIYCVFRATDQIEDGFLYKLLKTDRYRQIFAAATNASVDRRGSLRWKEFAKISVPLPPLDEQRAINELIDAASQSEQGYVTQLAALRQEKSALMQQLLTGNRRVKLEAHTDA